MNAKTQSLNQYLKFHLGMSVGEYSNVVGVPERTLQDRWNKDKGREQIQDSVFRLGVERLIFNR